MAGIAPAPSDHQEENEGDTAQWYNTAPLFNVIIIHREKNESNDGGSIVSVSSGEVADRNHQEEGDTAQWQLINVIIIIHRETKENNDGWSIVSVSSGVVAGITDRNQQEEGDTAQGQEYPACTLCSFKKMCS